MKILRVLWKWINIYYDGFVLVVCKAIEPESDINPMPVGILSKMPEERVKEFCRLTFEDSMDMVITFNMALEGNRRAIRIIKRMVGSTLSDRLAYLELKRIQIGVVNFRESRFFNFISGALEP